MNSLARHLITLGAVALAIAACSEEPKSLADYVSAICAAPFRSASAEEAPFLTENVSAMTKMMIDMGVRPTGDVDNDFVGMMVPHHQGAIDMAIAELRYGRNERLRRMAQEIIVTQQQEIAAMRLAVGEPLPPSVPSPTQLSAQEFRTPDNRCHADRCKGPLGTNMKQELDMKSTFFKAVFASTLFAASGSALAGQAPGKASDPDVPMSHRDRVYAAEQFSNTVSVTDPVDNRLLGVIRLGEPQPGNMSPLYHGQVLVHGMGYSPDHKTIAVVSIASNSVTFIDTATNATRHITYVGRAPHEAFFTPDDNEVWVTVRGEDYIAVLDGRTFEEKTRIKVPAGPGMQIFSPDGMYGYVCSSFNPDTVVITVADHQIVGHVKQDSPFCPNIAATPDGKQVWLTLKDTGTTQVFDARPPFAVLKVLDTGPITNHVNFVWNTNGMFAYVTIGALNEVQVFRTSDFTKVATIPVGLLPHGIWPSGDGTRVYVGLENGDGLAAIDTLTNKVTATIPIGQAPQALAYVSNAVPDGDGMQNLHPLGDAGQAVQLVLEPAMAAKSSGKSPTSVSLFDQGLTQVLEASVSGLLPKQPYVLGLATKRDGKGSVEPLAAFTTNPAGSAIVNAVGPIRQIVEGAQSAQRRYLVIVEGTAEKLGAPVQVQAE